MTPARQGVARPRRAMHHYRSSRPKLSRRGLVACSLAAAGSFASAQSIEPRTYANTPVGVNFLIAGYAYTRGALEFESLPVTDTHLHTSNAVLAYATALDFWGKSGKFDVIVPYTWL